MGIYHKKTSAFFLFGLLSLFLTSAVCGQNIFRKINDFDGDGKADFAVTRNANGSKIWYILQSTDGFRAVQWGFDTDVEVAGDYDGDGKFDIGIFRKEPVNGLMRFSYWIIASQAGVRSHILSVTNSFPQSVPVNQDFNGDGATDLAYTHSNGTIQSLCSNNGTGCNVYGYSGTVIKIGDMTGDRKDEISTFTSNGTNNVVSIKNTVTDTTQTIQFGTAGDEFVAADFDGDGKGDLTVYRPSDGTWWWMRSSDNVVQAATFGTPGDVPVPADYDGDGRTDIAIWRSGTQSYFWVYGSQVGNFALPWGIAGDTVVRY